MRRCTIVACLALLVLAAGANASAGDLFWRVRAIYISPDESSETILDSGSEVAVDSQLAPEFDVTWMFARHWGMELVLATARHDLAAKGGALDKANLGSVGLLPPSLLVQYHFLPEGSARPYVGLGLTVATFYNYNLSATLDDLGVEKLVLSDSVAPAAQLGIDIDVSPNWFLNLDLKYAKVETDVKIVPQGVPGDALDLVTVDIDPWIVGLGLGYRF